MSRPYLEVLEEWLAVRAVAKQSAAKETRLRQELFAAAFPAPTEGTNKLELPDGRIVKGDHKINRSVDQAAVQQVMAELRELGQNDVTADEVFPVKYELSKSALKKLSADGQKIASKAIVAKPGMPGLDVV